MPISGLYARPGTVMREGAEMAVDHINAQGGVKSLGGAKLKLVVLDCGDTTEKAKNAAQRMVAQETDLVAASAAYLEFVHARGHRGDGAGQSARPHPLLFRPDHRPRLQIRLPDLGDRRVASQAGAAADHPLAEGASGKRPEDGRDRDRQHRRLDCFGEVDARRPACRKQPASSSSTRPSRRRSPTPRRWSRRSARRSPTCCSSCRP